MKTLIFFPLVSAKKTLYLLFFTVSEGYHEYYLCNGTSELKWHLSSFGHECLSVDSNKSEPR